MHTPLFRRFALATLALCLVAFVGTRVSDYQERKHDEAHQETYHSTHHGGTTRTAATSAQGDVLYEQSFPMRAGDRLVVTLASEDVSVERTTGSGATVVVNGRGRDAREEFERRRFSAAYDDGTLRIRTDPERRRGWSNVRAGFDVIVRAPERMDVEIQVASGDVRVDRVVGPLAVESASGDVELGTIQGPRISVEAASGDITAESLDGPVSLSAASGDIEVGRIVGDDVDLTTASGDIAAGTIETDHLEASAASGDVDVERLLGRADVSTGSGDVSVYLTDAADISTGSGSVTLYLPRGAGFDVDLESPDIDITEALSFSGSTGRRSKDGRLGDGGPRLDVSTGSGSITLRTN